MKKIIILLITLIFFSGCFTDTNVMINDNPTDKYGNLEVAIQDQFTEVIDLYLNQKLDNLTLLLNTSFDDKFINVSTVTVTPLPGHFVCLKDVDGQAFYQGEILSVVSLGGMNWQLELDTPLDYNFTVDDGCALTTVDLNVDGSITPQIFQVSPYGLNVNVSWDITRVMGVMRCDGQIAPDDSTLCNEPALANGVVLRKIDGVWKNLFNFKTNGDLRLRTYDTEIIPKTIQGEHGVSFRRSLNGADKNGVTTRLNAFESDAAQVIIQDDLTNLEFFRIVVQGHVVE